MRTCGAIDSISMDSLQTYDRVESTKSKKRKRKFYSCVCFSLYLIYYALHWIQLKTWLNDFDQSKLILITPTGGTKRRIFFFVHEFLMNLFIILINFIVYCVLKNHSNRKDKSNVHRRWIGAVFLLLRWSCLAWLKSDHRSRNEIRFEFSMGKLIFIQSLIWTKTQ